MTGIKTDDSLKEKYLLLVFAEACLVFVAGARVFRRDDAFGSSLIRLPICLVFLVSLSAAKA